MLWIIVHLLFIFLGLTGSVGPAMMGVVAGEVTRQREVVVMGLRWVKGRSRSNGATRVDRRSFADAGDGTHFMIEWVASGSEAYRLSLVTLARGSVTSAQVMGHFARVSSAREYAEAVHDLLP